MCRGRESLGVKGWRRMCWDSGDGALLTELASSDAACGALFLRAERLNVGGQGSAAVCARSFQCGALFAFIVR